MEVLLLLREGRGEGMLVGGVGIVGMVGIGVGMGGGMGGMVGMDMWGGRGAMGMEVKVIGTAMGVGVIGMGIGGGEIAGAGAGRL